MKIHIKATIQWLTAVLLLQGLCLASSIPTEQAVKALESSMMAKASQYQGDVQHIKTKVYHQVRHHEETAKQLQEIGVAKLIALQKRMDSSHNTKHEANSFHGVMVFVSLSMPDASLQAINQQAARLGIPVLLRGFYQDDLTQTIKRMEYIMLPNPNKYRHDQSERIKEVMGGFSIDPQRFKQFGITQVPAFVIVDTDTLQRNPQQTLCENDFDVLTGNISLEDALSIFSQKAQAKFQPIVAKLHQQGNGHV